MTWHDNEKAGHKRGIIDTLTGYVWGRELYVSISRAEAWVGCGGFVCKQAGRVEALKRGASWVSEWKT